MEYVAGFSAVEITAWEPEMQMMGWVHPKNRVTGVRAPLHARAMVVRGAVARSTGVVAHVVLDLWSPTTAVRQAVLDALASRCPERGFDAHSVCLSATHTHSGPSGFSHFLLYNSGSHGFSPLVFHTIVDGIVEAIIGADDAAAPADLFLGVAAVPLDEPVAFNRSQAAHNGNEDVEPTDLTAPQSATYRDSVTLCARGEDGRVLGLINFFAVHGTSVHSDNTWLHSDNKGMAATLLEDDVRGHRDYHDSFVALFAQESAGDVSPNFRWSAPRRRTVGLEDDDHEAARRNGEIQARYARRACEAALQGTAIHGPLGGLTRHVDMGCFAVSPRFSGGLEGCSTSAPVLGLSMAAGTLEGPGPVRPLLPLVQKLVALRRWRNRRRVIPADVKPVFFELARGLDGRLFGLRAGTVMRWAGRSDPGIGFWLRADPEGTAPWAPRVLVVQLQRVGSLVIAALPVEPTTQVGRRIRKQLVEALGPLGITDVVCLGYANGYAGYATTFEEYQFQEYEGGHTMYGPWTSAAFQTVLAEIAGDLVRAEGAPAPAGERGARELPPSLAIIDEDALIAQRLAGRTGLHGPATTLDIPR